MSTQTYLIDTNVIIGLEDNHTVQPAFAALISIAAKHKVDVLVHEAARDDILRDRDANRQKISLSKLEKFQTLKKVRGLGHAELEGKFGLLSDFETDRLNYPRFITATDTMAFGVPIKEAYHDTLYPDLKNPPQPDLFEAVGVLGGPKRPGNTIRKVYLCRAQSNLGPAGSLLFFYKGKSKNPPSQALTAVGIFEECSIAQSTKDLMHMTGGRSVYSEAELNDWGASPRRPVKVINYLLAGYIDPSISLDELHQNGVIAGHPPQSIFAISRHNLEIILPRMNLGFQT
jgi:hypothetical protein